MRIPLRRSYSLVIILLLIFSVTLSVISFARPPWRGGNRGQGGGSSYSYINTLPKEPLSEEEKRYILQMREEEKLARDVYLTLSQKYNLPIFQNISRSEQNHMNCMKALIVKYGLEDPVKSDEVGVFTNEAFRNLYVELVNEGSANLESALKVGRKIELIDIEDLDKALSVVDNEDVRFAFSNLRRGSYNHLRAFERALSRYVYGNYDNSGSGGRSYGRGRNR